MTIINVHQAKSQLSKLIERAEAGEEVVIARAGKPAARLVAYATKVEDRTSGAWRGQVTIADDFDALPDAMLRAFEGDEP